MSEQWTDDDRRRVLEHEAKVSLLETREKQAAEMCTWLTAENQRLRDQLALSKHLDSEIDEILEDDEDLAVENVQLQHLVIEACDMAAKWLAVVTGETPCFPNGDTKRSAERIAEIRAAMFKERGK